MELPELFVKVVDDLPLVTGVRDEPRDVLRHVDVVLVAYHEKVRGAPVEGCEGLQELRLLRG